MAGAIDEPWRGIVGRVWIHPGAGSLIIQHGFGDERFTEENRMMNLFAVSERPWLLIRVRRSPIFLAGETVQYPNGIPGIFVLRLTGSNNHERIVGVRHIENAAAHRQIDRQINHTLAGSSIKCYQVTILIRNNIEWNAAALVVKDLFIEGFDKIDPTIGDRDGGIDYHTPLILPGSIA